MGNWLLCIHTLSVASHVPNPLTRVGYLSRPLLTATHAVWTYHWYTSPQVRHLIAYHWTACKPTQLHLLQPVIDKSAARSRQLSILDQVHVVIIVNISITLNFFLYYLLVSSATWSFKAGMAQQCPVGHFCQQWWCDVGLQRGVCGGVHHWEGKRGDQQAGTGGQARYTSLPTPCLLPYKSLLKDSNLIPFPWNKTECFVLKPK